MICVELWIRSQDKEYLDQVNHLRVHQNWIEVLNDSGKMTIGVYPTKERALEVLDDISQKIKIQFIVKANCLLKPSDLKRVKDQLEKDYIGDFIMEDQLIDIKPINQNLIYYEMPQE